MILVFDMGATHTRLALADSQIGQVVYLDTDRSAAGLDSLVEAMHDLAQGQKLQAVVGGMPGELEGELGKLTLAPNLPEWLGVPVKARMRTEFNCPVYIHNDLVVCGIGEAHDGAGTNAGVMVYYTVSTGVNAVRLVGGRVDGSIKRYEIGFEIIGQAAGRVKSLETLVGGAAMQKRTGKLPADLRSDGIWRRAERDLAHGLYNTLLHWTPDVVVIGGSMMRDIRIEGVRVELEKLPKVLTKLPELREAALGDLSGVYGAWQWWNQYHVESQAKLGA
jgi:glucokinase